MANKISIKDTKINSENAENVKIGNITTKNPMEGENEIAFQGNKISAKSKNLDIANITESNSLPKSSNSTGSQHYNIVLFMGFLSLATIILGFFGLLYVSNSQTELSFLGFSMKTDHISISMVAIGLLVMLATIRLFFKK